MSGISGPVVSAYLLAYGVATAVGSYAGGRYADANAWRALVVGSLGVLISVAGMRLFGAHPVVVAAWATSGIGPADHSGPAMPPPAVDLASQR